MKKFIILAVLALLALPLFAADEARDAAVKELLPDTDLKAVEFNVDAALTAKVQDALANKMPVRPVYEIYVTKTGAVVIEEQMGKWGPIKIAVLIDPATVKVKAISVFAMSEKRGAGIKQANFLNQFKDKGSADITEINKGIRAISGATVSSKAVLIAVKRALVIYEAFTAGR